MGDMGDDFRALRQHQKDKRAKNTKSSTEILAENRIGFESKNFGSHLIVTGSKGKIDFWPSTGKWRDRNNQWQGRGVIGLLKRLKNGDI